MSVKPRTQLSYLCQPHQRSKPVPVKEASVFLHCRLLNRTAAIRPILTPERRRCTNHPPTPSAGDRSEGKELPQRHRRDTSPATSCSARPMAVRRNRFFFWSSPGFFGLRFPERGEVGNDTIQTIGTTTSETRCLCRSPAEFRADVPPW